MAPNLHGWEHLTPVPSNLQPTSPEAPGISVRPPRVGTRPGASGRKSEGIPTDPSCPPPKHPCFHTQQKEKLRTWLTISQVEFLEQKYLLNLLPKHQAGDRRKKKQEKEGIFLVIKSELFTTC